MKPVTVHAAKTHVNPLTDEVGCKSGEPVVFPVCKPKLDDDALSLYVPKVT
jgi:hypothetical protein